MFKYLPSQCVVQRDLRGIATMSVLFSVSHLDMKLVGNRGVPAGPTSIMIYFCNNGIS